MAVESVEELFHYKLKIIYYIEHELSDKLSEMANETINEELSREFDSHQSETANQIKRLENVFEHLEMEVGHRESRALQGVFEDKTNFEDHASHDALLDLFYKGGAMKIERLEINAYENLINLANMMDVSDECMNELQENLNEEKDALESLQQIEIEV